MRFLTKLHLIVLPFLRSEDAPLEKKYMSTCPYCGCRGEEHPGVRNVASVPDAWTKLNKIYMLSCYKRRYSKKDWHVIEFDMLIIEMRWSLFERKNRRLFKRWKYDWWVSFRLS